MKWKDTTSYRKSYTRPYTPHAWTLGTRMFELHVNRHISLEADEWQVRVTIHGNTIAQEVHRGDVDDAKDKALDLATRTLEVLSSHLSEMKLTQET